MPLLMAIIQSLALLLPLLRYERLNFQYPYKQPYYRLYSWENIIIIAFYAPINAPIYGSIRGRILPLIVASYP